MLKWLNIGTAFVLMVTGMLLWFSWKRSRALEEKVSRMRENYQVPEEVDDEGERPYDVLDDKLRKIERDVSRMKEQQNRFERKMDRMIASRNNRRSGNESSSKSNMDEEKFINELIGKAQEKIREEKRKTITPSEVVSDFDPSSRERVERYLNSRIGEDQQLTDDQMNKMYSIYKEIEEKRKEEIRKMVEHYRQTGEDRSDQVEEKLEEISKEFRDRAKNVLGPDQMDSLGNNIFRENERSRNTFSGMTVGIVVRNNNVRFWTRTRYSSGDQEDAESNDQGDGNRDSS